jgi:hypothetical protein
MQPMAASVPSHGGLGPRRRRLQIQGELFVLAPHLLPVRIAAEDLPRHTWLEYLSSAADRLAEERGWTIHVRNSVLCTLEALVATQEPGRPYRASEVASIRLRHRNAARTLQVLTALDLLDDDRPDADTEWLRKQLDLK